MSLPDLLDLLDETRETLTGRAQEVRDLYRSVAESLRTLAVPFRSSLASTGSFEQLLDPANHSLGAIVPPGRAGEVEHNTARLIDLINRLHAIRNTMPAVVEAGDAERIAAYRRVHQDVLTFLDELYQQNSGWILQDPGGEASVLARQKRRDIEEMLKEEIDPFFERFLDLRGDEYTLKLNIGIRQDPGSHSAAVSNPETLEGLLQEKCAAYGLAFDAERSPAVLRDLRESEEELERRIRERYEEPPGGEPPSPAALRRKYLSILQRYLARVTDVSAVLPLVEEVYALYQPRPGLLERLRLFLVRLLGRDERPPRRDVQYSYIIGREQMEHRRGSVEELIRKVNTLEKTLLRIKNHLNEYAIHKRLGEYPVLQARELIDRTRASMQSTFDECFGLAQWLSKPANQEKMVRLPATAQRDLNAHLDSIYATLIINGERMGELARRYGQEGAAGAEGGRT